MRTHRWPYGPCFPKALCLHCPLRIVHTTHCKEAWNLSTAPFHSLYFRFSHLSLSLYGFRDHPRMPSNYGCYQISNRLSLNSVYYQKTPWIIIKMYEKSGNFDKTQDVWEKKVVYFIYNTQLLIDCWHPIEFFKGLLKLSKVSNLTFQFYWKKHSVAK